MKIKRFVAKDIRAAMRMVKEELGADAVIMSNRSIDEGVEIIAAKDFDDQILQKKMSLSAKSSNRSVGKSKRIELADFEAEKNKLHVLSSQRKLDVNGETPKKSVHRNIDQYIGYAERIHMENNNNSQLIKNKPAIQSKSRHSVRQIDNNITGQDRRHSAIPDNLIQEMRKEIKILRTALDTKLSEISWNQEVQRNPVRIDLLYRLAEMGFSKKLAIKIANRLDSHKDVEFAFQKAKEMLTKVLPISNDILLQNGGIIALIGPTGVGKTTTIAKLAAEFILKHGVRQVAIITTDNYRIGAHEQITTYARLLDVPVRVASNADELRGHINSFSDKQLILIDTAGMSHRDMRLAEQIQTLQQEDLLIKTYLVMSAATQYKAMNEIINAYKIFEPECSILTKLDETATLGSTLSVIIEHQLPISFISNGQQVPEDLCIPDAHTLFKQCSAELVGKNEYNNEKRYDEWVAQGYA